MKVVTTQANAVENYFGDRLEPPAKESPARRRLVSVAPSEPKTRDNIAGIVLAAGAAERMGEAKQLLPYQGLPLLQHVVDAAGASRLDRVVVVIGAYGDEVEAALHLAEAATVRNPGFERGNMSSLECGAALVPEAEALVLLMGDHPGVNVGVIDQMVALWRDEQPWGAVTQYSDRIGHPFLLSRAALDEAVGIGGPKLLWRLLGDDPTGRVTRLLVDLPAPIDVNTPEDYDRLLSG
jgi:molybdenum cofactor cytidylyltransferase